MSLRGRTAALAIALAGVASALGPAASAAAPLGGGLGPRWTAAGASDGDVLAQDGQLDGHQKLPAAMQGAGALGEQTANGPASAGGLDALREPAAADTRQGKVRPASTQDVQAGKQDPRGPEADAAAARGGSRGKGSGAAGATATGGPDVESGGDGLAPGGAASKDAATTAVVDDGRGEKAEAAGAERSRGPPRAERDGGKLGSPGFTAKSAPDADAPPGGVRPDGSAIVSAKQDGNALHGAESPVADGGPAALDESLGDATNDKEALAGERDSKKTSGPGATITFTMRSGGIKVDGEDEVGLSGLVAQDPAMSFTSALKLPMLIVALLVALIVSALRRSDRLQFAARRAWGLVRRRVQARAPVAASKLGSLLPFTKQGQGSRQKTRFSDLPEAGKARESPDTKDTAMVELKRMSLLGEYTPKMKGAPDHFRSIVSDECLIKLTRALPARLTCKDWRLMYSTELHGYSLLTAYQKASAAGPFLLVVMDMNRFVFGAFCSESLQVGERKYYGTGESFVFQLEPKFSVYNWSGRNEQFIVSTKDMLAFGGGGKFALWLDPFFDHGSSEEGSTTFDKCPCLASREMFKCCAVEIWAFTSPSTASPKRGTRARKMVGFPKSIV